MLNPFSIQQRLVALLALVTLALLCQGIFALWQAHRLYSDLAAAAAHHATLIRMVDAGRSAQVHFKTEVQEWKNTLIRGRNPSDLEHYREAFASEGALVLDRLYLVKQLSAELGVADRVHAEQVLAEYEALPPAYAAALNHYDPSQPDAAQRVDLLVRGIDRGPTARFDTLVAELRAASEQFASRETALGQTIYRQVWLGLALLLAAVVLIVTVGAVMIIHSITRPLAQLESAMHRITTTNELSHRAEADPRNEIGRIAGTLNAMIERLEVARTLAEAASRAKTEFVAHMSHELRTPLNGVIGMTDLLLATGLGTKQRRFAEVAKRSGEELLLIINDILDLSKIEAGRLQLESTPFNVGDLIEDLGEKFALRAQSKGLELLCSPPLEPIWVEGDVTRLRQVLTNLLGNAIKFTAAGEVRVLVSVPEVTQSEVNLCFAVSDTGIGISAEQRERLFQDFAQGDASTTRRFGGTGLGLSIAHRLVVLMGGSIVVESTAGKGSTFLVQVRLARAQHAQSSEVIGRRIFGLHALIVDDNERNREILERQLNAWGIPFRSVGSGAAALRELFDHDSADDAYNVLITDYLMPGMDGEELIARVRAEPSLAKISIVLLSSAEHDLFSGTGEASPVTVLTKPVRQSEFYNCLASIGRGRGTRRPSRAATAGPGSAPSRGSVLLVEDHPANQEVTIAMLESESVDVTLVNNGAEALERVRTAHFDLVMMDCQMPLMDGYAATRALRRWEVESHRPRLAVVAVTANASTQDRELCLDAGMDDYIAKPVTRERLRLVLERWLPARPAAPAAER
jgi:two-component system, sensor histidine kinase and response regulator